MAELVYLLNGLCYLCSLAVWSLSLPKLQRWPNQTHTQLGHGPRILHSTWEQFAGPACLSFILWHRLVPSRSMFFPNKEYPKFESSSDLLSFFPISHGRFRAKTSLDFDPILAPDRTRLTMWSFYAESSAVHFFHHSSPEESDVVVPTKPLKHMAHLWFTCINWNIAHVEYSKDWNIAHVPFFCLIPSLWLYSQMIVFSQTNLRLIDDFPPDVL